MKKELAHLLHEFGVVLGVDVVEQVDEFLRAGEERIAFEELCSYLYECGAKVTDEHIERIGKLGVSLGVDSSYWTIFSDVLKGHGSAS